MIQNKDMIFMLEDDLDDRMVTTTTLDELGIKIPVVFFSESEGLQSALAFGTRPSLIIIDYESSTVPGMDTLKAIRGNHDYKDIPIVVLGEVTVSSMIRECYRLGANSYITKPSGIEETKQKIKTFFEYWFQVAEV